MAVSSKQRSRRAAPALTRRGVVGCAAAAAVALLARPAASAAVLPPPSGAPILTVSGKIRTVNVGAQAVFDRAMLESLGRQDIVTRTPWYKQSERFEGVPMARLMQVVGAYGTSVLVSALNDYSSEIPLTDFTRYGTVLALKRNGAYMPVSDKGPLFIIYPFDSNPDLRQDKFYMRSVWQVSAMEVR